LLGDGKGTSSPGCGIGLERYPQAFPHNDIAPVDRIGDGQVIRAVRAPSLR
jgi:hypothetical protein